MFQGFLLATVDENGRIIRKFPNKYIQLESWDSTPNQREEIKAYRDDNTRDLYRLTAAGRKSVWSFKTRKDLHLADKMDIQDFFVSAEINHDQRTVRLMYWNDEESAYKTGVFYRPNAKFPIKKITEDDIIYKELDIEGVEC